MGAKSGAVGHITIGMGSQIAAKAGVSKTLPPGKNMGWLPNKRNGIYGKRIFLILENYRKDKKK